MSKIVLPVTLGVVLGLSILAGVATNAWFIVIFSIVSSSIISYQCGNIRGFEQRGVMEKEHQKSLQKIYYKHLVNVSRALGMNNKSLEDRWKILYDIKEDENDE